MTFALTRKTEPSSHPAPTPAGKLGTSGEKGNRRILGEARARPSQRGGRGSRMKEGDAGRPPSQVSRRQIRFSTCVCHRGASGKVGKRNRNWEKRSPANNKGSSPKVVHGESASVGGGKKGLEWIIWDGEVSQHKTPPASPPLPQSWNGRT